MGEQAIINIGLMRNFGICFFWRKDDNLEISLCLPFLSIQVEFKRKTQDNEWFDFYNAFKGE